MSRTHSSSRGLYRGMPSFGGVHSHEASASAAALRSFGGSSPSLAVLAAIVVSLLGVFGVAASTAEAQKSIGGFIGDLGGGNSLGGQFNQPRDVAVNLSGAGAADPGDMYVSETGGRRVQVLDEDGNFKFLFGRDVIASGAAGDLGDAFEICTVAADCKAGVLGTGADGPGGELNPVQGIAVDQSTGRVYVFERHGTGFSAGNRRVQEFSAAGQFLRAWGWDVVASGPGNTGGFEVCVAADGDVCQAGSAGVGGGQFGALANNSSGVAVSPVDGHLFVVDPGNRRVLEFDPSASGAGVFVRGWGWDVDKTSVDNRFEACTTNCGAGVASVPANANGAFATPLSTVSGLYHLTVDSQGVVYASDSAPTAASQRILRFDSNNAPVAGDATAALLASIDSPPLYSSGTTPTVGLEIDTDTDGAGPDEESLLVARDPGTPTSDPTVVQELDIPTAAGETPADPVTVAVTHTFAAGLSPAGLGVNSASGLIFLPGIYQTPSIAQGIFVLASGGGAATVLAQSPTVIGTESVTLEGSIDPNGVGRYQFEIAEGGGTFTPVGDPVYVSGSDTIEVEREVSGLEPNTFYRFRIRLTKQTGLTTSTADDSNEQIFLTAAKAPDVATLGSAQRTDTSVELRGTVDPNGSATTYRFEYGPEGGSFDHHVPIPDGQAGSGQGGQLVTHTISGLIPDTGYRYRVVATNSEGATTGDPVGFRTLATGSQPGLGGRAFELVSPPDKVAGIGVGPWYGGPGAAGYAGRAAHRGERFAVLGEYGSMLLDDAAQGFVNDWAFADRKDSQVGWVSHSPITHAASGPQDYRWINMKHATPDLSKVIWRSNGGLLRPFGEMGDWAGPVTTTDPSFIGDWEGRWEIFGPTHPDQILPAAGTILGLTEGVLSADGSTMVGAVERIRGLAGPSDPMLGLPGGALNEAPRAVYLADISNGLADSLSGTGAREPVGVCTAGTEVVRVDGSSDTLEAEACPAGGLISEQGLTLQRGSINATALQTPLDGTVSGDGSRVFFMSPDPQVPGVPLGVDPPGSAAGSFCVGSGLSTVCPPQLFVRARGADGGVVTRWISRSRSEDLGGGRFGGGMIAGQASSLLGQALFEGASSDGDKVFFRSNSPLTPDDPNGEGSQTPGGVTAGVAHPESWDLYMYDFPDGPAADPGDGTLTRVSAGPTGASDPNNPQKMDNTQVAFGQGMLRFVSDDGKRAYFVTAAPVGGVSVSSSGTVTAPGGAPDTVDWSNLYVYDADRPMAQRWRFVARLPRDIDHASACATTGTGAASALSPGSAAEAHVVSLRPTANCVRGTADGGFVTLFTDGRLTGDDPDGVSGDIYGYDAVRDELSRLSAPQGGVGGSYPCGTVGDAALVACYGDGGFDADDSAGRYAAPALGVVSNPLVAGDRLAFFQSRSRLVVGDTDSAYDVYQWRNGELSLLTPGDSAPSDGQMFKGNDDTGRNVYVATRDRLSWQDVDSVLDVYTARIDGGISQPPAPVVCGVFTGGCHGPGVGTPTATDSETHRSGDGDVSPGVRVALNIAGLSRKARAKAARTGVLSLRVRVNRAGPIRLVARARIGKRSRRVAAGSARLEEPGSVVVRLRLSGRARRALARGRGLRVSVRASSPGAKGRTVTVALKRSRRS